MIKVDCYVTPLFLKIIFNHSHKNTPALRQISRLGDWWHRVQRGYRLENQIRLFSHATLPPPCFKLFLTHTSLSLKAEDTTGSGSQPRRHTAAAAKWCRCASERHTVQSAVCFMISQPYRWAPVSYSSPPAVDLLELLSLMCEATSKWYSERRVNTHLHVLVLTRITICNISTFSIDHNCLKLSLLGSTWICYPPSGQNNPQK